MVRKHSAPYSGCTIVALAVVGVLYLLFKESDWARGAGGAVLVGVIVSSGEELLTKVWRKAALRRKEARQARENLARDLAALLGRQAAGLALAKQIEVAGICSILDQRKDAIERGAAAPEVPDWQRPILRPHEGWW